MDDEFELANELKGKLIEELGSIATEHLSAFNEAIADDLNTPAAILLLDAILEDKRISSQERATSILLMDNVLGLNLLFLGMEDLRIRPKDAQLTEADIDAELERRKEARAAKDFATSDAIRDSLAAKGVEVMDGDPLGWEWRL